MTLKGHKWEYACALHIYTIWSYKYMKIKRLWSLQAEYHPRQVWLTDVQTDSLMDVWCASPMSPQIPSGLGDKNAYLWWHSHVTHSYKVYMTLLYLRTLNSHIIINMNISQISILFYVWILFMKNLMSVWSIQYTHIYTLPLLYTPTSESTS